MVVAAVAVVAVLGGVRFGLDRTAGTRCAGEIRLSVAVSPDIAPAVRGTVDDWPQGIAVAGSCVAVDLRSTDPVDVAAALGEQQGVSLTGVGAARGSAAAPDVWIPDSATWLVRLRSAAPTFAFTEEGSVALSPVVVAMPEPVARTVGWLDRRPTYADVLREMTTSTTLRSGTVEPTRDAVGLSGMLALSGTADPRRPGTATDALRALATGRSVLRDDLLAQFPRSDDPVSIASGLGLAALAERDVVAYNGSSPAVPLTALYLEPAPAPLDYPFAVMPDVASAQAEAARRLYEQLSTRAFRDRLAALGIRGPDGNASAGFRAPAGSPETTGSPRPTGSAAPPGGGWAEAAKVPDAAVVRALAGWSAVVAPARILTVVDASDSMRARVPTADNATRMRVAVEAARGGLALFSDDWQVGLWKFAAGRGGGGNHEELVPIGSVADRRQELAAALGGIRPGGGDAGLYRTILDAYQHMQGSWQAGRVNSVLVLTDGVGGSGGSGDIPLATLLDRLGARQATGRPVQVIVVGLGDAVDRAPLDEITRITGGGVFIAGDPADIGSVFLKAISLRTATTR